jgi:dolichol-phosphate mannosyltransferase
MGIYFISRYYTVGVPIQGWTSLIVTLFFLLGIMMTQIGVLGLYIGKIFNETKARPLYAIRQQTDDLPTTSRVNTSMEKTE